MISDRDLYTFTTGPIPAGTFGTSVITYEIRRYRDVRNLQNKWAYQVLCTQRIIIPNATPYSTTGQGMSLTSYSNYPAIVTNNIAITGASAELVDYFPKTINSSIATSVSSNVGGSVSVSQSHASGSSTSQSNTFGVSASLGFFGDLPTGGVSASYDQSYGSSQSTSASDGNSNGVSRQNSNGESMSVKDWACYSSVDISNNSPNWVWGQEYPWNVIQFGNVIVESSSQVTLPPNIQALLSIDSATVQAAPPSDLSLFGLDFTMKANWIVEPDPSGLIMINHELSYCTATHTANGNNLATANINPASPFTYSPPQAIDLCLYGLDPIMGGETNFNAVIGFIPNKFLVLPTPYPPTPPINPLTPFKIISPNNNLIINDTTQYAQLTDADAGAGFSASETSLTATFTQNCSSLTMTAKFKIVDTVASYTLFIKHWKMGSNGVVLTIVINGDTTNSLVEYVTASEAEGGQNNLLAIVLRNFNFSSANYCDALNLGLNQIDITLTPIGSMVSGPAYQVRAISVEAS